MDGMLYYIQIIYIFVSYQQANDVISDCNKKNKRERKREGKNVAFLVSATNYNKKYCFLNTSNRESWERVCCFLKSLFIYFKKQTISKNTKRRST